MSDGSSSIFIGHSNFSADDIFDWTADLDDTNAVVRGSNGGGTNQNFVSSTLNIGFAVDGILKIRPAA